MICTGYLTRDPKKIVEYSILSTHVSQAVTEAFPFIVIFSLCLVFHLNRICQLKNVPNEGGNWDMIWIRLFLFSSHNEFTGPSFWINEIPEIHARTLIYELRRKKVETPGWGKRITEILLKVSLSVSSYSITVPWRESHIELRWSKLSI